jgi:hypothetical protein
MALPEQSGPPPHSALSDEEPGFFVAGGAIATVARNPPRWHACSRFHGSRDQSTWELVGYNSWLDALQAAFSGSSCRCSTAGRAGESMSHPTRWVGIDLHRRRSQIAIIDEHGELTLQKPDPDRPGDDHRGARRG